MGLNLANCLRRTTEQVTLVCTNVKGHPIVYNVTWGIAGAANVSTNDTSKTRTKKPESPHGLFIKSVADVFSDCACFLDNRFLHLDAVAYSKRCQIAQTFLRKGSPNLHASSVIEQMQYLLHVRHMISQVSIMTRNLVRKS